MFLLLNNAEFKACSVPNSVHLTKFSIDHGGRLEICSDGRWKSVCGIGVNHTIANVVCRQLNYAASGEIRIHLCGGRGMTLFHFRNCVT